MTPRARAEEALRRIEERIGALDALPESRGRDAARELLEAVLDLHGLALARILGIAATSGHGEALFDAMGSDEQVAAVLLLHGLHPKMPEARVREALKALAPGLRAEGAEVSLLEIRDGVARLRLVAPGAAREAVAMLRREIEEAIVEAAPDLDEIAIRIEVGNAQAVAAA